MEVKVSNLKLVSYGTQFLKKIKINQQIKYI